MAIMMANKDKEFAHLNKSCTNITNQAQTSSDQLSISQDDSGDIRFILQDLKLFTLPLHKILDQSSFQQQKADAQAHLAQIGGSISRMVSASGGDSWASLRANIQQQKRIVEPPAPSLTAFALTTFVLSLINLGTCKCRHRILQQSLHLAMEVLCRFQLLCGKWPLEIPPKLQYSPCMLNTGSHSQSC